MGGGKLEKMNWNGPLCACWSSIHLSPVISFWEYSVRKMRKSKKKPVKGEFDRLKQAEKKKRRLEKALATSAAIRSELEKKKQRKVEEFLRLEEEGAATAETVALYVLLGDESEDSKHIMLKEDQGLTSWGDARNIDIIYGGRHKLVSINNPSKYSTEDVGSVSNSDMHEPMWHHLGNSMVASCAQDKDVCPQYPEELGLCSAEITVDHISFQAVASLKIADVAVF